MPYSAPQGIVDYDALSSDRRRELTADLLAEAAESSGAERDHLIEEVILLNLVVARTLAARYRDRGIPLEDLEQVAAAALVRVAQTYEHSHDRPFLAYAVPSIRGELRRYFRDRGWGVRPPRRIQELRLRALDERDRQRAECDGEPSMAAIAAELGVPESDVVEALTADGCFTPSSLDVEVKERGGSLGDGLGDERGDRDRDAVEAKIVLHPHLRRLRPRDRRLLHLRYYEELTQREIAEEFGVTQTHVSRMLAQVLADLRAQVGEIEVELPPTPVAG